MSDEKITTPQDKTLNYLIQAKEYSDKHPDRRPMFTVWIDEDGEIFIQVASGFTSNTVRYACLAIGAYGVETTK